MVEKLSRHIALWLIKSGILENDDIDLYIYAIQYLLLIINPTIIFTAYCIATHNITIGLIEVFSFLLIRKYCGGYHCQSSTACLIFSAIILIGIAWLSSLIKPSLHMFSVLVIADIELIIKGPIISVNHSVSDFEKIYHYHNNSCIPLLSYNKLHISCNYILFYFTPCMYDTKKQEVVLLTNTTSCYLFYEH